MLLRCDGCRATSDTFQLGWCSFYTQVPDEDAQPVLMTYCAPCAHRESISLLTWLGNRQPPKAGATELSP